MLPVSNLILRVWSSNLIWCAQLGLTIYLICYGLTGCPQVNSWCLHNHICASHFLAGKKDWSNGLRHRSALNTGKPNLGLQSCLLFSSLVFSVSESLDTADILGYLRETQLSVSNLRKKKKKMTLYILKEFSLKSTNFFNVPWHLRKLSMIWRGKPLEGRSDHVKMNNLESMMYF